MVNDPKSFIKRATKITKDNLSSYRSRNKIGGQNDLNDLYQFTLTSTSSVDLELDKLKSNVDVEIYTVKKSEKRVNKAIGRIDFEELTRKQIRKFLKRVGRSRKGGQKSETITKELREGNYCIRVYPRKSAKGRYRLTLNVDPLSPTIELNEALDNPSTPSTPPLNSSPDQPLGQSPNNSPDTTGGGNISDSPHNDASSNSDANNSGGTDGGSDFPNNNPGSPSLISSFNRVWIQQFGTAQDDESYAIALDSEQNLYLGGGLGGSAITGTIESADAFLASYDSSGTEIWQQSFGNPSLGDSMSAVVVTSSGQLIGGGTTNNQLPSATDLGTSNGYFVGYSRDGQALFDQAIAIQGRVQGYDVAVAPNNQLYFAGSYFDITNIFGADPAFNSFVYQYDVDGNVTQTIDLNLMGESFISAIAVDDDQNIYVAGITNGTLNLSGGDLMVGDFFISKLNSTGQQLWIDTITTDRSALINDITVDSNGTVYIAGSSFGSIDGNLNQGSNDAFLAQYNAGGDRQWLKSIATSGYDEVSIALDESDRLFAAGSTGGSLFGNTYLGGTSTVLSGTDTLVGGTDAWIAHLDADGNVVTSHQFGTALDEYVYDMTISSGGQIYVTGSTNSNIGGSNMGGLDAWVAQYSYSVS